MAVAPVTQKREIRAMAKHQVTRIPPEVMAELRRAATMVEDRKTGELKPVTQPRAAHFLGVARRTIQQWEQTGGKLHDAYALIGLAFRLGGELRSLRCLEILAQLEHVEGVKVAASRERSRVRSARYRERKKAG
jgi:DNA-binding transcriptional regulator YiaG